MENFEELNLMSTSIIIDDLENSEENLNDPNKISTYNNENIYNSSFEISTTTNFATINAITELNTFIYSLCSSVQFLMNNKLQPFYHMMLYHQLMGFYHILSNILVKLNKDRFDSLIDYIVYGDQRTKKI